jgi:outer membrane protein TolC
VLREGGEFSGFLRFALLSSPRVAAAYYRWVASVESITVERSLPDPVLSFEADITDVVMTLMPGVMQEFPGPGKLRARGAVATAESGVRWVEFRNSVLEVALELKRSFYARYYVERQVGIHEENLALLGELEAVARARNEAGKVSLQDVLRAQIMRDRVATELDNLRDSRLMLRAEFKAAMGLRSEEADPPLPGYPGGGIEFTDEAVLLEAAFAGNPELALMRAEVAVMEASIEVAYRERVPDFRAGLMADVKSTPVMVRPQLGMTLPIWRDKVAAGIASAEAGRMAVETGRAEVDLRLAAVVAGKSFGVREVGRTLRVLQDSLIPKAQLSLELARVGYLSGEISFFNLIDAEQTRLELQLAEVEARMRRDILLAEISYWVAGVQPAEADWWQGLERQETGTEP